MLEIMTYAGAVMVLFTFAIMLVGPGPMRPFRNGNGSPGLRGSDLRPQAYSCSRGLFSQLLRAFRAKPLDLCRPVAVGASLFSTYLLGVELASALLLAA